MRSRDHHFRRPRPVIIQHRCGHTTRRERGTLTRRDLRLLQSQAAHEDCPGCRCQARDHHRADIGLGDDADLLALFPEVA